MAIPVSALSPSAAGGQAEWTGSSLPCQITTISTVRRLPSPLPLLANKRDGRLPKEESVGAETLATRLADVMKAAWHKGERPIAEDFLSCHPEVSSDTQAAVRLIYEEICLRQEFGQEIATEDVINRFPQWQAELRFLLDCHGILQSSQTPPAFPSVGDTWMDFRLVAELGRGTFGCVFLATQPSLADRPVVLKIAAGDLHEHLSLARLQHTHIVPLYTVQDDPEHNLRALCMPYFGGTSFAQILEVLKDKSVAERTGRDLLDVVDKIQAVSPVSLPLKGPARLLLERATYVQAICWIGACLAEGLQYAHERGLVHLDLKPGNVLLAIDGQPMLLDFNLAREPLRPGDATPEWFGGTPVYMSPEQQQALTEMQARQRVLTTVDGRSDIYSLGLVLYEALAGPLALPVESPPLPLDRCNPQVSVGLADIVQKCLATDPDARYADAATLASDLRLHLSDCPLRGVRNRSPGERWRKWRRRRPHVLAVAGMLLTVLMVGFSAVLHAQRQLGQQLHEARTALAESQEQLQGQAYSAAVRTLTRGLAIAARIPGTSDLSQELAEQLRLAQRAQAAQQLHTLTDRLRFLFGVDSLPTQGFRELEAGCQALWNARHLIMERGSGDPASIEEDRIRTDLLDLAILWADLRVRQKMGSGNATYQEVLRLLAEAETELGSSSVLAREQQTYAEALGQTEEAQAAAQRVAERSPRTAWEHYALGRAALRSGNLTEAMTQFERAIELQPQDFWPNFYLGLCAYRLAQHQDAVNAFRVCLALSPHCAQCFYNRALAQNALGHKDRAFHDYNRALDLDPSLAGAALNRGILHYQAKRHAAAHADLEQALANGADAATVHYNRALVYWGQGDRLAALASLRRVLELDRRHAEARQLYDRISRSR